MGWYMRVLTEEDDKRFSEFMDKWRKDHPVKQKKELSDFDYSDEARERDEADFDSSVHEHYENMMTGGEYGSY